MPPERLVGTIVPLYKNKGDAQDVNNYRGITLLSCMGKLFTSTLNERLNEYSNTKFIINETQAGFRHEYSTLDHIFLLKCIIYCSIGGKGSSFVCLWTTRKLLIWCGGKVCGTSW